MESSVITKLQQQLLRGGSYTPKKKSQKPILSWSSLLQLPVNGINLLQISLKMDLVNTIIPFLFQSQRHSRGHFRQLGQPQTRPQTAEEEKKVMDVASSVPSQPVLTEVDHSPGSVVTLPSQTKIILRIINNASVSLLTNQSANKLCT